MLQARILIVPGDAGAELDARRQLSLLGYHDLVIAPSATPMSELIVDHAPDLILIDAERRVKDLAADVRAARAINVPVICLTQPGEGDERDTFCTHLSRPVSGRELHATIQWLLERRRADRIAQDAAAGALIGQDMQLQQRLQQLRTVEMLERFMVEVARDFRDIFILIKDGLESIAAATARRNPDDRPIIEDVLAASRRGQQHVRSLLAFARQGAPRPEPTRIDQLLLETSVLLQRALGADIDVVTNLNAEAATVQVDASRLANALWRLAFGVRNAMPKGSRLVIGTESRDAVSESGNRPSVPEVRITLVAEASSAFGDVDGLLVAVPGGSGAGLHLSAVHELVEQAGGRFELAAGKDGGRSIAIRLPCVQAGEAAGEATGATAPSNRRREVVLLVEDDPDAREVVSAQLRHLGYEVQAVANGNEAINVIESPANIDVLLTDVVLPGGVDGVKLVQEAIYVRPTLGVLCMSGYSQGSGKLKSLKIQNIELLEKPFSTTQLAEALSGVVLR